jgi:hypothetical protein
MLNVKKINVSDFSNANISDMRKLARSLNPFFDSIQRVMDKGITVSEHLPFEYTTFEVTVDAAGIPTSSVKLPTKLTATIQGLIVISVSGGMPTATPFILYTLDKNIVTINKILGLPSNIKFKITALVLS